MNEPNEQAPMSLLRPNPDPKLRVVIAGLPYSENVGDGVVAECVAWALQQDVPGVDVQMIDLAGRLQPGDRVMRGRSAAIAALGQLPGPLRRFVVHVSLARLFRRTGPAWRRSLSDADLLVIPGGQLFSGLDLNFPRKVSRIAELARDSKTPIVVGAAGVARDWSPAARRMFREMLGCDLRFVGLRDPASLSAWNDGFGPEVTPDLVPDPGLLAGSCYGRHFGARRSASDRPIGVGITGLATLAYHADSPIAGAGTIPSSANLSAFMQGIVLELVNRGHRVRLFCNGSAEDADALGAVIAEPEVSACIAAGIVEAADAPRSGKDLAAIISGCRAVVAHRLHACIVAYSYLVPVVGLAWDQKLDAFFDSVDLAHWLVTDPLVRSSAAADLVERAISESIDRETHSSIIKQCRQGLLGAWQAGGLDVTGQVKTT